MEKIYKREKYLQRIRKFYDDIEVIKVITGIRRCGKSFLLKTIIRELYERGVSSDNIIVLELDSKEYKHIKTPKQLEKLIDSKIIDKEFQYLFIDEVQNVKGFEVVINAYREEKNISIFITGSNSYLLSGELATKLTGRCIEFEMFPLNFYEYIEMKKFLNKDINYKLDEIFKEYIRCGGFPGSLHYDDYEAKMIYTTNIIKQIFEKDIMTNNKIKDKELFEIIQKFVINNFGSILSIKRIYDYLTKTVKIKVDRRTIKKYLDILVKAKIVYSCDLFDIKSKLVLKGDKKYYLADSSIYFALNTDNRINYGPVLENIMFIYLKSKDYSLSVGKIGKFECDFIARKYFDNYYYIQISKSITNEDTEEREYRPYYCIKDSYPRYLFTLDTFLQKRDGVKHVNILEFISNDMDLS